MTETLFRVSREERTLYETTYTRQEVIDLLCGDGGRGDERDQIEKLSDTALLALLLNDTNEGMDVYDRVTGDSENNAEIVHCDDWTGAVITVEQQEAYNAMIRGMVKK